MKIIAGCFLFVFLVFPALPSGTALAQWRTESFVLDEGWNAIYVTVDTGARTIDELTAGSGIDKVWKWRPEALDARILERPEEPVVGEEWQLWNRDEPGESTFFSLGPNAAYLVHVEGEPAGPLELTGRVVALRTQWRTDGLNLLGFPTNPIVPPTVSQFFGPSEIVDERTEIYGYVGGELESGVNPALLTPGFGRVGRGKAYWVRTNKYNDYDGPIRARVALADGLEFGAQGSTVRLVLTNRADRELTATLTPMVSESEPGTDAVPNPVPLTRRMLDASGSQVFVSLEGPHTLSLQAGETRGITIGIDRGAMAGEAGDSATSLLKIVDGEGLSEVYLPVSAEVASLAGLWVGRAEIDRVQNQLQRFQKDAEGNYIVGEDGRHVPEYVRDEDGTILTDEEGKPIPVADDALNPTAQKFPLQLIIHVDESGAARLLSKAFVGAVDLDVSDRPIAGVTLDQSDLLEGYLDTAVRLSAAHLPAATDLALGSFGAGARLEATLLIAHDDVRNPFIHTYHPDHDNLDPRFEFSLPAGVESFQLERAFVLTVDADPGELSDPSWGTTLLTGNYAETFSGLHKKPIAASGRFALRKVTSTAILVR